MKRSEEILGLAIISISDGREVGRVKDIVVNPDRGAVECLVVEDGTRYLGVKVIPFKDVEGIGEYAVTVASESTIVDLDEVPNVNNLLERNVYIKGTKVLTRKGTLIGQVTEYIIDEDNEGQIVGCHIAAKGGSDTGERLIPKADVVTFGKDVLVVVESPDGGPIGGGGTAIPQAVAVDNSISATETKSASVDEEQADEYDDTNEATETSTPPDPAKLFEQRQRQYMLGRKAAKQILDQEGNVLAEEGEVITEELLDQVKAGGKWSELTMNTKG